MHEPQSSTTEAWQRSALGGHCRLARLNASALGFLGRDGCHHCGQRTGKVVGDHIPPNKLVHGSKAVSNLVRKVSPARIHACTQQN